MDFPTDLQALQKAMGYDFADMAVLQLACVHRSYFNEQSEIVPAHNERLEFIGDAALDLLIADYLYKRYPENSEGDLSTFRAGLVQAKMCTEYTLKLKLEPFLLLGKGEERNEGRARDRLMANFFEALLGALYLDGGMPAVSKFFFTNFQEELDEALANPNLNWKALLQDYAQRVLKLQPVYEVVDETGPDHSKRYTIVVKIDAKEYGSGIGASKKEAEALAARSACKNNGIKS